MATVDADLAASDTTFDDNLARAQAGADRDRAAIDEPVMQADA